MLLNKLIATFSHVHTLWFDYHGDMLDFIMDTKYFKVVDTQYIVSKQQWQLNFIFDQSRLR